MNEVRSGGRFLRESLSLLSTYLSGERVELGVWAASVGADESGEAQFAEQLRLRHSLAYWRYVFPIVRSIESAASKSTAIERHDITGPVRGRLDIPRYVRRHAGTLALPAAVPVVSVVDSPATPENAVAKATMGKVAQRLRYGFLESRSAEGVAARRALSEIATRLHSAPWRDVRGGALTGHLLAATQRRLRRRQTGNEVAYERLLDIIRRFDYDLAKRDTGGQQGGLLEALVAFPAEANFLDRVFEIWCLQSVLAALQRIGGTLARPIVPLSKRGSQPVAVVQYAGQSITVWFQRALASGSARWRYVHSGAGLRAIPDILLESTDGRVILVDAKHRLAADGLRADETYKVLGYFENYRGQLDGMRAKAILAFVTKGNFEVRLRSEVGGEVALIGANEENSTECRFLALLEGTLSEWLGSKGQ